MNRIGGKWKILIIYAVSQKCNRFSQLQRAIPDISKQMLVNQLRELEANQILERTIFAEIPPRVEYAVTDYGRSLMPVITAMQTWGITAMQMAQREISH